MNSCKRNIFITCESCGKSDIKVFSKHLYYRNKCKRYYDNKWKRQKTNSNCTTSISQIYEPSSHVHTESKPQNDSNNNLHFHDANNVKVHANFDYNVDFINNIQEFNNIRNHCNEGKEQLDNEFSPSFDFSMETALMNQNNNNIYIDKQHTLSLILFTMLHKYNALISLYNDLCEFINNYGHSIVNLHSGKPLLNRQSMINDMHAMVFGVCGKTKINSVKDPSRCLKLKPTNVGLDNTSNILSFDTSPTITKLS